MNVSYLVGLDLGQVSDYTALAVLERRPDLFALRHLARFPLGTPYVALAPDRPGIVEQVREVLKRPPLPGCILPVDATGVGRGVVDALRAAQLPATLLPITITSGSEVTQGEDGSWRVPKRDLVACMQVRLQSGRLKIAEGIPLADVLLKEFGEFKVKVTAAANETFGAWREGQHDDLVLAVALACWAGERFPGLTRENIGRGTKRPSPPRGETLGGDFRRWPKGV